MYMWVDILHFAVVISVMQSSIKVADHSPGQEIPHIYDMQEFLTMFAKARHLNPVRFIYP